MVKKYKILCENCKKIIVIVSIYSEGENKQNPRPVLKFSGVNWINSVTHVYNLYKDNFTKNSILRVAKLIEEKDFKKIAKMDYYHSFGFFCRDCEKNYCLNCWRNKLPIFDGISYDYTKSTCPNNHRKMIDD